MNRFATLWGLGLLALMGRPGVGLADVKPHVLFTDGAVLQRAMPVPIWGTADEGEEVVVKFQGQEVRTTARDGKWKVKLAELRADSPSTLTIQGKNKVEVADVAVGEVWICSGQSNMEFKLARTVEADAALAHANDPLLRLYTVPKTVSDEPLATIRRSDPPDHRAWEASDSESAAKFSAVAYFFGRDLRKALGVPVGLIHTSWGGTAAEAWTSRGVLEADPSLRPLVEGYEKSLDRYPEALEKFKAAQLEHRKKVEQARADGKEPPPAPRAPVGPKTPHLAALYNGMIVPLQPYAIRGAIWYQGESNAGRAFQYRTLFPAMIKNWRDDWNQGDFPFLFVQLAPYRAIETEPGDSDWAELREAQLRTSRTVPATAMAVITDLGEQKDVHPRRKEPVGARLALAARAMVYRDPVLGSGPEYDGMEVRGDRVVLRFRNVGRGLVARDGPLTGFAIAGEDRKFVNTQAAIEGETVVVHVDRVAGPVAVRFGWANFPVVNLWNADGLPASPFRTDDFPMITDPANKDRPAKARAR